MTRRISLVIGAAFLAIDVAEAGLSELIHHSPSGFHGHLSVMARAGSVVSLRIEDSPSAGGNLVSQQGIDFGEVNNLGSTQTPGVTGTAVGNVGHFEAEFLLTAERSGVGGVTLHCQRSSAGNFNAKNGVEIDDSHGVLRPLSAHLDHSVTVLHHATPGTYEKTLAINIHPQDKGQLRTILKFTLCAL